MIRSSALIAVSTCVALCCATMVSAGVVWDTVVFRDNFDYCPGPPDPDKWVVNHPGESWWTQGRTHFPDPLSTTGPFPRVERVQKGDQEIGVCVIEHHLFNPWDSPDDDETVPRTFLGGEIHTTQEFNPNRSYRIEARVRSHASPNGLVTSFFTFGFDGCNSDEIDFEFLSNKTNDDTTYPDGDPVLTNTWNESFQKPEYVMPTSLDLSKWNTFWIYWYPQPNANCPDGGCVEWWWLDPVNRETLLRTETDAFFVPDEPMAMYFNFWAPCYTSWNPDCDPWDDAADRCLQPVNTLDKNEVYRYEIDYVEVRASGQANFDREIKLTASDGAADDLFGVSVSVSGDTAVVGAPLDDDAGTFSGSAYVFVRSGSVWTEQQKLTASDAAANDFFGVSVSVSGDTAVVGASGDDHLGGTDAGSAYVFVRSSGVWTQQQKLTASDAAGGDGFGGSVSATGDTAVVGAHLDDDAGSQSGSAYVFVGSGGVWTEQQKLTALDAAVIDWFGFSVAVSGDSALVGALFGDGDATSNSGSAYVFLRCGGVWTQQQKLTASDPGTNDQFGLSVSLSGDTALVGARGDDDAGTNSGSAYVFVRSSGMWTEQQKLTAFDGEAGDQFGGSVSVSGDTAVVGARLDDDAGTDSGSAYVFVRSGGVWTEEQKLAVSDAAAGDEFGSSVSVSVDVAVVSAMLDDCPVGGEDCGSVYVFMGSCADSDGDGVCNSDDVCPETPAGVAVDARGRPLGDLDCDCNADLTDFNAFSDCLNGPGSPPAGDCVVRADLDADGDVDLYDFRLLQQGFTGPIQP